MRSYTQNPNVENNSMSKYFSFGDLEKRKC